MIQAVVIPKEQAAKSQLEEKITLNSVILAVTYLNQKDLKIEVSLIRKVKLNQ